MKKKNPQMKINPTNEEKMIRRKTTNEEETNK